MTVQLLALHRGVGVIKRTIEISQNPAHLTVRLDQLQIIPFDAPRTPSGEFAAGAGSSIPCEDIGMVLVDEQRTTYSHAALARLVEFDAVLVVCGRDHLPAGILLPLGDHSQVVWRIADQVAIKKPLAKQLWKQLVQAKVRAQAMNLAQGLPARGRLMAMIDEVGSGDKTNVEAQAARLYWQHWLRLRLDEPDANLPKFARDQDGEDPLNIMLNYGYAVLRAAVARAIVAAGLLPAIGLHHSNRSNAFCLADDLVEPLRPMVDRRVRELHRLHDRRELDRPTKAGLLELLARGVMLGDERGPLMVAIHRFVASLVKCYAGETKTLSIPVAIEGDLTQDVQTVLRE